MLVLRLIVFLFRNFENFDIDLFKSDLFHICYDNVAAVY